MINIDLGRDDLLTKFGYETLGDRYLINDETSPQQAFARAACAFADDTAHAQRLYDYASKLWFMFATPVLSNAPTRKSWSSYPENFSQDAYHTKMRGLPISCFLNHVDDSRSGLSAHYDENIWLASMGGGIGGYWGAVRSDGAATRNGSQSSGVIPFLKVVDSEIMAFNQGVTRRGSYAAYLDISHPEVEMFMAIRKPTGGDANRKCLNLHHGVVISDEFMECARDGRKWALKDPHTGETVKEVSARYLWEQLLNTRMQTGEPYIMYGDTVNDMRPEELKKLDLKILQSNLCSEITLPTGTDYNGESRTAVCCLSSVNLAKYDEWKKDEQFIPDLVRMLDNVLTAFISLAPDSMSRAKYSAMMERSVGLGAMGFHTLLQQRHIPFASAAATALNKMVFKKIKSQALEASEVLGKERGAAEDVKRGGGTRRNMHLMAIAPNASSSIICGGTSPSIEPIRANVFTHKTLSGSHMIRNTELEKVLRTHAQRELEALGKDVTDEAIDGWLRLQWDLITENGGSVSVLSYLDDYTKEVFATAMEIDQHWVVQHAADRAGYICQAQSVNLFFQPKSDVSYVHSVHWKAWSNKLKTLYYLRSEASKRAENVNSRENNYVRAETPPIAASDDVCLSCEG